MSYAIYERLRAIGARIESHHSDLRTPATPEALAIIRGAAMEQPDGSRVPVRHEVFRSPVDDSLWVDVPFAYAPFWPDWRKANGLQ